MKRCAQCYKRREAKQFIGARGKPVSWCATCRNNYRGWDKKTPAEKAAIPRRGVPALTELRARLILHSKNEKLGDIPASITSRGTCPTTCSFYDAGCYALYGKLAHHWRRVGEDGDSWDGFLADVRALPPGQLWRANVMGDLPASKDKLLVGALLELILANVGKRGFTFSHHRPRSRRGLLDAFHAARALGFVINLSADSLDEADQLAARDIGPVAVVAPGDMPDRGGYTPAGRKIVVCPAETRGLTCEDCQLCAQPDRKAIVAFRAHGQMKAHVSELVQLRVRRSA